MLTEEFIHSTDDMLRFRAEDMLAAQQVQEVYYNRVTGTLHQSLRQKVTATGGRVTVEYPMYVRFLDMKMNRDKGNKYGIYNRFVFGYMYYGLQQRLRRRFGTIVTRQFKNMVDNG